MRVTKLLFAWCVWFVLSPIVPGQSPRQPPTITSSGNGIRLTVDEQNDLAALRVLLPGQPDSDPGILVVFPEHVTARELGKVESQHLYLFRPGRQSSHPAWRRFGQAFEYQAEFQPGVRMVARATLEEDGVRYHYEFVNGSKLDYEMMQAVTDPRMVSPYFHDVRLERTYVHHKEGFELLASETPERLTMSLNRWLPNRYRASYTWAVEQDRVAQQSDGITWYNKSRAVDEPFIATTSTDGKWIMATFSYDPGNLWVNPELTCQHADPQLSLPPGQTRSYELKTLIFQGTLEQVLMKVKEQRRGMKH